MYVYVCVYVCVCGACMCMFVYLRCAKVTDNGEKEDKCPGARGAEGAVTSSAGEDAGPADTQSGEPAPTEDQIHGNGAPHALPVSCTGGST